MWTLAWLALSTQLAQVCTSRWRQEGYARWTTHFQIFTAALAHDRRRKFLGRSSFRGGSADLTGPACLGGRRGRADQGTWPSTGRGATRHASRRRADQRQHPKIPLGPSKAAARGDRARGSAPLGGRYDLLGETRALAATFAEQHGLKPENVSGLRGALPEPLPLYRARSSPPQERGLVTADPSYEERLDGRREPRPKARISKVALYAVGLCA